MPFRRIESLAVRAGRPGWLTAGTMRLAVLSAFIVAVGMLSPRLTPGRAGVLVGIAALFLVAGGAAFLAGARRIAVRLPFLEGSERADAFLMLLRRIGLPLLGLAFFLFWTFAYVGLWAVHPDEAFKGLDEQPRFSDFFYYAVSTAFTSPPEGIAAGSRGVRSATMIELFTAIALLTAYLSSFVDWHRDEPSEAEDGR